jgi:hypothetical protein
MCSEDDDTPVGRREYELLLTGPARDEEIGRFADEEYDELLMVEVVKLPVPTPVPVPQNAEEDELGKP